MLSLTLAAVAHADQALLALETMDPLQVKLLGERLSGRLLAKAVQLLLSGAVPNELDDALTVFGFVMGPLEAEDLVGLDKAYLARKASNTDRKSRTYLESGMMIPDRMVQEGRLGKIAGVGWYRYPGGKGKVEDPLLEDLIREEAHFAGITQQSCTPEDVVREILQVLHVEALAIVKDMPELTPEHLDGISIEILGFPNELGGLLYHMKRSNCDQA